MKSNTQGFLMATILLIVGFCGWGAIAVVAQQPDDEDQTRQVFAEEFLKARPAGQRRTSRPAGTSGADSRVDGPRPSRCWASACSAREARRPAWASGCISSNTSTRARRCGSA